MDTKEIFDAEPLSAGQFLSETGQGLYIPPYQRNYSWEFAKVSRLIDDVAHGLEQMKSMSDSICFLGTVIALRDSNYVTVEPMYRREVPAKVMTIIDGQQRLTTLLLALTILHEEIRLRAAKVRAEDAAGKWLQNQSQDVTGRLLVTFEEDRRYGDGHYRYFPRAIRAYYDVWSRQEGEAKYISPIGHYLYSYTGHARSSEASKAYRHQPLSADSSDEPNAESHRHFHRTWEQLRRLLRRRADAVPVDEPDEMPLLGGKDLIASRNLQDGLFNGPLAEDVLEGLDNEAYRPLCSLIILANYVLLRVTVAVVTAKREEYGFDMFEALNTTGEPLTAIETFKPRVIREEGLSAWKTSASKASFDRIEAYLDKKGGESTDKRQNATSSILIPFALAQNGDKLSKRLTMQRNFLRRTYDEVSSLDNKRNFMALLTQVVVFLAGPWQDPHEVNRLESSRLAAEAAVSIAAVAGGNHDVVIAPLSRYFAAYRLSETDSARSERAHEFLLAARTTAAFYALWRGAHGGTTGIDAVWRKAMLGDGDTYVGLARRQGPAEEVPPVADLQSYLRRQLEGAQILQREQWVRKAATQPLGSYSSLARFLLLAASHDSTADVSVPGLVLRGRSGLLPMLDLARWEEASTFTVEHIAPEEPDPHSEWDTKIYDTPGMVHCLGNLTLLPHRENASVSNRSWPVKRILYRAYSSSTLQEADELLVAAANEGHVIGKSSVDIVQEATYLPLLQAISTRTDAWDSDFVMVRSQRIADLAWQSLSGWLGIASPAPAG
jgi:hypothetical protein